jgi:NAD(P)-dependent dehydrogenase (short-subunit alcohol dehydrogenase family)
MRHFNGRVAAITGAASGIGAALAVELARRGCEVAVSDVDTEGLERTATSARRVGPHVSTWELDVADRRAVHEWADKVVAHHGKANLVFNNAGVALGAPVSGMDFEDLDWLMGINFDGVVNGTKAFLPHLKESGEGHVVNISSVFGFVGIPSQSAYNAAKFAVRGFTEALRLELDMEDCGVSATTVHPGGIRTNIARNARMAPSLAAIGIDPEKAGQEFEKSFMTTPEKAARVILAGVEKDRRRVLIGPDARLFALLGKLPPGAYQPIIARGARLQRR